MIWKNTGTPLSGARSWFTTWAVTLFCAPVGLNAMARASNESHAA